MKKSQITYAVWPWGTKTKEQAAEAARDVTAIGYTTFDVKAEKAEYQKNTISVAVTVKNTGSFAGKEVGG